MNEEPNMREEPAAAGNPWENPVALSKVPGGYLALFTLLWILSSMLIPLADKVDFVLPAGIAISVGLFFLTRKKVSAAVLTMVGTALLLQFTFYGAYLGAVLLAAVVGTLTGAYLFTCRKFFWLVPVGAIVAGGLTYLYTENLTRALFCAVLLPAALLLGTATLRGEWRRSAIRFALIGVLLGIVAAAIWYVIDRFGVFNRESLVTLSNGWKGQTERILFSWRDELFRAVREQYAGDATAQSTLAKAEETIRSQWSDATLANAASLSQIILPAVILIFCQAVAYLAQKLLSAAYRTVGPKEVVQLENEYLTASVPAAILFMLTFLISIFGDAADSLFFAVSENIFLFFLPALLIVGFRVYLGRLVHATPIGRMFLLVLSLAILCCSFRSALALLGLMGAWNAIAGAISRASKNRMQDDE